jgi:hypothetical protein
LTANDPALALIVSNDGTSFSPSLRASILITILGVFPSKKSNKLGDVCPG